MGTRIRSLPGLFKNRRGSAGRGSGGEVACAGRGEGRKKAERTA